MTGAVTRTGSESKISFAALSHSNGTTTGRFELRHFGARKLHASGDVTCMSVVGNQAWIGGVWRRISAPELQFIEGWETVFRVVDNGEGARALPDQVSFTFEEPTPGFAEASRSGRPELPVFDIEAGNIQVR